MLNAQLTIWKAILPAKLVLWQHPSITLMLVSLLLFAISATLQRVGTKRDPAAPKPTPIAFAETEGDYR
jgi:hypothetical protein